MLFLFVMLCLFVCLLGVGFFVDLAWSVLVDISKYRFSQPWAPLGEWESGRWVLTGQ